MITSIPDKLTGNDSEFLTSGEVAELFRVHLSSVRRWSREGKLVGYRLGRGGDWRFIKHDVLAFLKINNSNVE